MTFHVCIEGAEGTYKTTTCKRLFDHYTKLGYRVLLTKEPGVSTVPSTMRLREIMLSNQYDSELTPISRELISQAIRSIQITWLETLYDKYDFVIQDRGVLSGRYYAMACGIPNDQIKSLEQMIGSNNYTYDLVLILQNENGLAIAKQAKNEFGVGDAMESRGESFHASVKQMFANTPENSEVGPVVKLNVTGMTQEQILTKCVNHIWNSSEE